MLGSRHSSDPIAAPTIKFNFLSTLNDRSTLVAAIGMGRQLMATAPLTETGAREIAPGNTLQTDEAILDWVRRNAETNYHPVGTCKMGNDDLAVVDSKL